MSFTAHDLIRIGQQLATLPFDAHYDSEDQAIEISWPQFECEMVDGPDGSLRDGIGMRVNLSRAAEGVYEFAESRFWADYLHQDLVVRRLGAALPALLRGAAENSMEDYWRMLDESLEQSKKEGRTISAELESAIREQRKRDRDWLREKMAKPLPVVGVAG